MNGNLLAERVIWGDGPSSTWACRVRKPHPALCRYVFEYQGYSSTLRKPIRRRQLPVAHVPVILNLGAPFQLIDRRNGEPHRRSSFVAGLHTSFVLVDSVADESCLQLALSPLGARRLFGVPMAEFADKTVELTDVAGTAFGGLVEELGNTDDWTARFGVVDRFILDRFADQESNASVAWAWDRLAESGGIARVGAIADALGWSHKRLGQQFREHIGLTPKKAGRLFRFNQALQHYQTGDTCPADIAAACGYADQAHMIHEFRALAGMTPRALMAASIELDSGVIDRFD